MGKLALSRFQQSLGPFACLLWKTPLKRDFTGIYLITFFGDGDLGTTSGMSVIVFFKNVQNLM